MNRIVWVCCCFLGLTLSGIEIIDRGHPGTLTEEKVRRIHLGRTEDVVLLDPVAPKWRRLDPTQYAGSSKCADCHKAEFAGWKDSAHNKMIRRPVADGPNQTVFADFTKESADRKFELKDVKWVIGHRWKQRFIGEIDGQEVVFPAEWSIKDKKWLSYEGRNDWWYTQHKDWKMRSNFKLCAGCHSTGSDAYTGKWVELNIACESCHGPGKSHSDKPKLDNIVNPARLSVDRSMDVCLSCHQSGKPQGTEFAWAVGYEPGLELSKFWQGFEPEVGKKTPEFWENGTAHKNRVQGNTFLQSMMAHSGLQCSNCHESHGSRHRSMTLKATESNALCLTCHGPGKNPGPEYETLSDHTHHDPLSTGSRCIECHMPKTGKNAVPSESRNHTFNFISPAATIKNGVPNSCNGCHADKTAEWGLAEVKKWYPKLK